MSKKKIKVLNISQGYQPAWGGAEKFMKTLSEYQANELGYEVDVWTTDVLRPDAYWNIKDAPITPKEEVINGVNVKRFPIGKGILGNNIFNKVLTIILSRVPLFHVSNFFSPPTTWKMLDIVNSDELKDYDIVTVSTTPYYFLFYVAYKISKKLDIPLVISPALHIGADRGDPLYRRYFRKTAIPFFMRAKKIITNTKTESEAIMDFLESNGHEIGGDKLMVTGQGVSLEEVTSGDGEKFREKYNLKDPIVFQVGSKNKEKGSYTLVRAMIKLWDKGVKSHLVFAGMPNPDFSNYISDLDEKYQKNIVNIDNISDEKKMDLFKAGDVFSMVSKTDSFGIVYLEAWANGIPVIGCNTAAIKKVIDDRKDGFLVDYDDDDSLSQKIGKFIKDKKLRVRMGNVGKRKVEKKYDWNKKMGEIGKIYSELDKL